MNDRHQSKGQTLKKKDKIAVISIQYSKDMNEALEHLVDKNILNHYVIHLVHVRGTKDKDNEITKVEAIRDLRKIKDQYFSSYSEDHIDFKCLFDDHPEQALCDYATRTYTELVIIPACGDNTFCQYLCTHCPASILISR